MGQNPKFRTPSEHPNPATQIGPMRKNSPTKMGTLDNGFGHSHSDSKGLSLDVAQRFLQGAGPAVAPHREAPARHAAVLAIRRFDPLKEVSHQQNPVFDHRAIVGGCWGGTGVLPKNHVMPNCSSATFQSGSF